MIYKILAFVLSLLLSIQVAAIAVISLPQIPITSDFTLPNGLRVVVSEDHSAPIASLALVYKVGSRNELKGKSGFAHLFEHMMFEGSENVGKSEHFKYIEKAGGDCNAETHEDFTIYYETLPSNEIELALWLESDRMRSLKVTEENFQNQLETVKEEKRESYDNQPYIPAELKLREVMFDNWVNSHNIIGTFSDLESSSIYDVQKFFRTYYEPNNAVLAIVGDVDAAKMRPLVEKYFGTIARQSQPPLPNTKEPMQAKGKYFIYKDKHAQLPLLLLSWKVPAKRDRDYYALRVLEQILIAGDSSRLYQRLVKGSKVAVEINAEYDDAFGPSDFSFLVIYKPGHTQAQVRELVFAELQKLKTKPVSAHELQKAKNQILHDVFASKSDGSDEENIQLSLHRAQLLAQYTAFFGNPDLLVKDIPLYMNVKAADIQRVATKYFTRTGLTVGDVRPIGGQKP